MKSSSAKTDEIKEKNNTSFIDVPWTAPKQRKQDLGKYIFCELTLNMS